jgi:hypothetical protein
MDANTAKRFFDKVEDWMVESGFIDQLSLIVTQTTAVRSLLMFLGGGVIMTGISDHNLSNALIGAAVTVATGSVTMFIKHVRDKHAAELQQAVGATPDKFIGRQTVAAVQNAAATPTTPSDQTGGPQ